MVKLNDDIRLIILQMEINLFIKVLNSTKLTLNKNIRHEYAIDITDSKIKEMHIELLFVTIALLVITVACYFQIILI